MNSLALVTVIIAVGSTEAKSVLAGKPMTMKPVIGGFILGLFLFTFAGVNQKLFTSFCYLVIAASLLVNGNEFFKVLLPQGHKTNQVARESADGGKFVRSK